MLSRRYTLIERLIFLFFILVPIFTMGCLSYQIPGLRRHPEFTTESQLEIIIGLAPEEIEKRFGPPDRTSIEMQGTATHSPWQALVYEYVMGPHPLGKYEYSDNINSFAFSSDDGCLQYWDIQLAYPVDTSQTPLIETEREIVFFDGIYVGQTKRGVPHGKGRYSLTSGSVYEGDFVMGSRTGEGTFFFSSDEKYVGKFLAGRPIGGLYTFTDGTSVQAYMDEYGEWQIE